MFKKKKRKCYKKCVYEDIINDMLDNYINLQNENIQMQIQLNELMIILSRFVSLQINMIKKFNIEVEDLLEEEIN